MSVQPYALSNISTSLRLQKIITTPPNIGQIQLGYTVPELLDQGCSRAFPGSLNQWTSEGWQVWPLVEFRGAVEALALGLATAGVQPQERAVLLLENDIGFALADFGSLLAGLVTVPLEPTAPVETLTYILQEVTPTVLFIHSRSLLDRLWPVLAKLSDLRLVVLGDGRTQKLYVSNTGYCSPSEDRAGPGQSRLLTLNTLQNWGYLAQDITLQDLKAERSPHDLATILYTLEETGRPLGAMLSHENLSGNILAAFSSMPGLTHDEIALSFLPLTHVFALSFLLGHIAYGHTVYFSHPKRVMKQLKQVRPTIFITVPRLLERFLETVEASGKRMSGLTRELFRWGWRLTGQYQLGQHQRWGYQSQLWLSRQILWYRWLDELGGRLRYVVCGGAALSAEVVNRLSAMGLPVFQGYGLTQTSSVLTTTRPGGEQQWNRAGSVGVPIPGVTLAISDSGEILVNSPYVMQGYWQASAATDAAFTKEWLHTGDRGHFSPEGLLTLESCQKSLFKLSIGEYVAPLPIAAALRRSPLIRQVLIVGPGEKFCGALLVPKLIELEASTLDILSVQRLVKEGYLTLAEQRLNHPCVLAQYQTVIDDINQSLAQSAKIRAFRLVLPQPEIMALFKAGDLDALYTALAHEIRQLYLRPQTGRTVTPEPCPLPSLAPLPA